MTFAGVANNVRLFLVCWVVVLDTGHDNHLMMMVTSGTWLHYGLVTAGPILSCCVAVLAIWVGLFYAFPAMTCSAMNTAGVVYNELLHLVCWVVVFDLCHANNLMMTVHGGTSFHYEDMVDAEYDSHTILQGCLIQPVSVPKGGACDRTLIQQYSTLTWDIVPSLVTWCSGFGGYSLCAFAAGWGVAVAVAHCQTMVGLYMQASDAPVTCDFGDLAVRRDLRKQSPGASLWSSGFSCPPYSRPGDGGGCHAVRAGCLPQTFAAAVYLHLWIIVLACTSPADADAPVTSDGLLRTGNPGPLRIGSGHAWCAVPHVQPRGFGFKQRTQWFIKELHESLQQHVRLLVGSDRPRPHLLLFHTGIFLLPWLAALVANRWLCSFYNGTFQRHQQAMVVPCAARCVQYPVVPLTTV